MRLVWSKQLSQKSGENKFRSKHSTEQRAQDSRGASCRPTLRACQLQISQAPMSAPSLVYKPALNWCSLVDGGVNEELSHCLAYFTCPVFTQEICLAVPSVVLCGRTTRLGYINQSTNAANVEFRFDAAAERPPCRKASDIITQ
jgi:hypothetical protein